MKKSFHLTATNKKPERQVDFVKHEIKKYIGRERRKTLPDDVQFWDFDCRMGDDASTAPVIHVSEINKKFDALVLEKKETFYMEILAKPGYRASRKPSKPID